MLYHIIEINDKHEEEEYSYQLNGVNTNWILSLLNMNHLLNNGTNADAINSNLIRMILNKRISKQNM